MIGIDYASVSGNATPDWRAAKRVGIGFALVRASHALYSNSRKAWSIVPDAHYARDWKKIPITKGPYMFPEPRAAMKPQDQVKVFADAVNAQGGLERGVNLPPVLDIEFPGGLVKSRLTRRTALQWMKDAYMAIGEHFDVNPILYTSARVWDGEDDDALNADTMMELAEDLKDCPLWLARYPQGYGPGKAKLVPPTQNPPVPKMWGKDNLWIHQYQGNALKCPGFTGGVDMNDFKEVKIGAVGEKVKWIQKRCGAKPDGIFGPNTQKALSTYQKLKGLKVTGFVDINTFAALAWV